MIKAIKCIRDLNISLEVFIDIRHDEAAWQLSHRGAELERIHRKYVLQRDERHR